MRKRRLWLVVRVNKKGKRKTTMPAKKQVSWFLSFICLKPGIRDLLRRKDRNVPDIHGSITLFRRYGRQHHQDPGRCTRSRLIHGRDGRHRSARPDVPHEVFFTPSGAAMMHINLMCFPPCCLMKVDRSDCGTAGREHRICDNDRSLLDRIREFAEIFVRLMSLLVAVETDMTDLCGRNEGKDTVYHSKTCAQDRNDR